MARKNSIISKRITKIQGLPEDETKILERIGVLVDSQINNRAPANPFGSASIRVDKRLPPPSNITAEPGIKSSKLSWPAVDSSILSHYEINVTSVKDGTEERFISYSNTFFFRGREGGDYRATVQSVGRNGTKSPVLSKVEFFVPQDVMLIEGAKNGFNTLGTQVSEDIYFYQGHKIYSWGSFTIDKLIGGDGVGNPEVALRLYAGLSGQGFDKAVFLEEISLWDATESATCLDNFALGGISRPMLTGSAVGDIRYVRGTTFETSYSIMFSPFSVADNTAGLTFDFYLVAVGRNIPNDIISLSLTIWSGGTGEGEDIPSIPLVLEPPYVFPWYRSIALNENMAASPTEPEFDLTIHNRGTDFLFKEFVPSSRRLFADTYTVGLWVKFKRFPMSTIGAGLKARNTIFQFFTRDFTTVPFGLEEAGINGFRIAVNRQEALTDTTSEIYTSIYVAGKDAVAPFSRPDTLGSKNYIDQYDNPDGSEYTSPNYTGGTPVWGDLDTWHFVVVTQEPGIGVALYINGIERTSPANNNTDLVIQDTTPTRDMDFIVGCLDQGIYRNSDGTFRGVNAVDNGNTILTCSDIVVYAAGVWNTILTPPAILYLYNSGLGTEINWTVNDGSSADYIQAGNLLHYWQMGATISDLQWIARDTGYFLGESGGITGRASLSEVATGTEIDRAGMSPAITIARNIVPDYPS